ncbi:NRDE family protein [Porticoccus sp.]
MSYNNAMCLIVFAWQSHAQFPLILVANRDEYYRRPTATAHFWEENPAILGGRDLQAGGTWMGIRRDGRWTAVTNYREGEAATAPRSRGELTANFLMGEEPIEHFAAEALHNGYLFGGFNLLLGDDDQLLYCSNREPNPKQLAPGIYSLSNHLLDSPWPKAVHAREALTALICTPNPEPEALLSCLQRDTPYADELLPDTGVGLELERMLSPPFIRSANYGTRSTTVLMKNPHGNISLLEQNYGEGGRKGKCSEFLIRQTDQ